MYMEQAPCAQEDLYSTGCLFKVMSAHVCTRLAKEANLSAILRTVRMKKEFPEHAILHWKQLPLAAYGCMQA